MKTKFMSTTLLAVITALGLGIGSAYAGDGGGPAGGYAYPDYIAPGSVYAGVPTPARNIPGVATVQNGQATHIFGTHSQSEGVWLFPPTQNQGANS
jgi:hypothetical protein